MRRAFPKRLFCADARCDRPVFFTDLSTRTRASAQGIHSCHGVTNQRRIPNRLDAHRSYSVNAPQPVEPASIEPADLNTAIMALRPERHYGPSRQSLDKQDLGNDFAAFKLLNALIQSGQHPTKVLLEHVLALACRAHNVSHISQIIALHSQYWLTLSERSIELIGRHYCETDALEQCLDLYDDQLKRGHYINARSWTLLIQALVDRNECQMMVEVLQRFDALASRHKDLRLPAGLYYDAMTAAADSYDIEAVQWLWNKIIRRKFLVEVDEGFCTKILNVCGRHGLPILATEVVRYIASLGISPKCHHFATLIESYCNSGDVKNAFKILDIMRQEGVMPTSVTAAAILQFMSTDIDLIDRAFFTLQDIKEEGSNIDVVAFNAVIDASVIRRDVSRALATYKEHQSLGVTPNVDTLHSLLAGCVITYQKDLALSLIKLFADEHGIQATAQTFVRLISVCVLQEDYEDAFKYLEEMKEEGHPPPVEVYALIVRRCLEMKDPRAKIAYEEMKGWGYRDIRTDRLMHDHHPSALKPVKDTTTGVLDTLYTMTNSVKWFLPSR